MVDLVQKGSNVNEIISEGENLVANPILKGHINQSQAKTHATWKKNARQVDDKSWSRGAGSIAESKKRHTGDDIEMRDLKKHREVQLKEHLQINSSVADVVKDQLR